MILCELLRWAIFRLTALADNCLMANQISALFKNLNEGKQLAIEEPRLRCGVHGEQVCCLGRRR